MCFGTYNYNNDLQKIDTSEIMGRVFDEAMEIHNDFFKRYYNVNICFYDPISDIVFRDADNLTNNLLF